MSSLRRAFQFFHKNAGYIVGRAAECALSLARSEQIAADIGIEFRWEWDDDPDDSWMSERERAQPHEWVCCRAFSADGTCLAGLCGIVDPDESYRRVVEAELASEALQAIGECAETAYA